MTTDPTCRCWIDDDPNEGFVDMRDCPIHDPDTFEVEAYEDCYQP